jgi:hypothetical protein
VKWREEQSKERLDLLQAREKREERRRGKTEHLTGAGSGSGIERIMKIRGQKG